MEKICTSIIFMVVATTLFDPCYCRDVLRTKRGENEFPGLTLDGRGDHLTEPRDARSSPGLKMNNLKYREKQTRTFGKRDTVADPNRLWKDGIVVYQIAENIRSDTASALKQAFAHFKERTCIRFQEKTPSDNDYIMFLSTPGCWSDEVGRKGGEQELSLGYGCGTMGAAVHEIMHALGFWHEQTRSDRDQYVKYHEKNVSKRMRDDFKKLGKESTTRGFPYDYGSIMHYEEWDWSRNGEKTIEVIGDGLKLNVTLGQRKGLSTIDMAQVRDMYGCNQKTHAQMAGQCVQSDFADGRDYRGDVDYTSSYITCQKWSEDYPNNHTLINVSSDGLGDHNKCRNPAALRRDRPWCYTSKHKPEWDYCDVTLCQQK